MFELSVFYKMVRERGERIMKSREDETYAALINRFKYGVGVDFKECELYEIAMSLGRIADMLAEMNKYIVDYDDTEKRKGKE